VDKLRVITVAKVGSASFKLNLEKKYKVIHSHSLELLGNVLDAGGATVVSGIRNPVDRNLSYFFQTHRMRGYNGFKTRKNNYKGECCFKEISGTDATDYIESFLSQKNLFSFNEWFDEFLNITNIEDFDKQKGLQVYDLGNKNKLIFYTLEKLNQNINHIKSMFNIPEWTTFNRSSDKEYAAIYKSVKESIRYPQYYLDGLLENDLLKMFYTPREINSFRQKARSE